MANLNLRKFDPAKIAKCINFNWEKEHGKSFLVEFTFLKKILQ